MSGMVRKYSRILKSREYNQKTNYVWAIQDVPVTWRSQTQEAVEADGYYFAEDGTAYPIPINVETTESEEE